MGSANHTYELLLALGVLAPLVSFALLVLFGGRLGKPAAGWLAVGLGMGVPMVLSLIVAAGWWGAIQDGSAAQLTENAYRWHWTSLGHIDLDIGIKLDSLTIAMYTMVTVVAFLIFVFSIGYMAGHSDEVGGRSLYHRYFAYLSLFGFSMLGLVVSSSLVTMFICWELVGVCSYLLIGFYFDKAYAYRAAIKAFVTNRVGDFGFLIGLAMVVVFLGTFDLEEAARTFATQAAAHSGIFAASVDVFGWQIGGVQLATFMGIGLFAGAMGKSAQFPLHVWLPDAMAGPTPVSALIHAATMVAAGVYLVARVFPLMTPGALLFIAVIGCLTLTLMALVAIVQTDIKKCLAYSTLSQLGYMIFGLGCGAWVAALFHLIMHAFFKAMLFLGSGQVIEGCHHEQDMRKMGGLRAKMPVTCWTFFVGVLAISGVGVAGTRIGLGGFFSKDQILAVAHVRTLGADHVADTTGHLGDAHSSLRALPDAMDGAKGAAERHDVTLASASADEGGASAGLALPALPKWMFWCALFTAYVTPFYMMRCWWMTFMGKPRSKHVHEVAHERPLMYVPLIALAIGTVLTGYFFFPDLLRAAAPIATAAPLVGALDAADHTHAMEEAHHFLTWGVGGAFIVGFAAAIGIYAGGLSLAQRIRRAAGPLGALLEHKYYINYAYDLVWVQGCLALSRLARFVDTWIVDALANAAAWVTARFATVAGLIVDRHGVDGVVNGVAKSSQDLGEALGKVQTGRLRNYVLFAVGAATLVLLVLIFSASVA
jgi:NADH-quinone oxidoreductase subunit L